TVVGAATIVSDAIDSILNSNMFSGTERQRLMQVAQQGKEMTIQNVLSNDLGGMIVSPKGIDELVEDVSRIIAGGINVAIHPDITPDNLSLYL
ncbi:MAG: GPR endopeptidase, partial [Halanaerobiaceae bacterium]